MKKWYVVVMMAVLVLAFAVVAQAGQLVPVKTADITFLDASGNPVYCDGLHMVMNSNSGLVKGARTGCLSDAIYGVEGVVFGGIQKGIAMTIRDSVNDLLLVVRDAGTWTYYMPDGSILNEGKWALGAPVLAPESSSSSSLQPAN